MRKNKSKYLSIRYYIYIILGWLFDVLHASAHRFIHLLDSGFIGRFVDRVGKPFYNEEDF